MVGTLRQPLDFGSLAGQTEYLLAVQVGDWRCLCWGCLCVSAAALALPCRCGCAACPGSRILRPASHPAIKALAPAPAALLPPLPHSCWKPTPLPQALYRELQVSWLTPVEIFQPHYGRAIGNAVLSRWNEQAGGAGPECGAALPRCGACMGSHA